MLDLLLSTSRLCFRSVTAYREFAAPVLPPILLGRRNFRVVPKE
jgi:hypothetical protein